MVNKCRATTLEHVPSLQQFPHAFPNSCKNENLKFKLGSKFTLYWKQTSFSAFKRALLWNATSLLLQGQVLTLALVSGAKVGKKKKDIENTLKDSILRNTVGMCQNISRSRQLSRENSPLRSWVSTPKENLPHDTVSHRQKCCFISLLPSACPWPVTENPTIRRKYRIFLLTEAEKQWKFTFISSVHQVQWYKLIFWPRRYQLLNCCKCAIFYPNI